MRYATDPGCPLSWATEPIVRKLIMDFGGSLRWTFVMGGLSRDYGEQAGATKDAFYAQLAAHWLAGEWRLRPQRRLTGTLWQPA